MGNLIGIAAMLAVCAVVWIWAGFYLRDHHAAWLRDMDAKWSAMPESSQDMHRAWGIVPSWERSDEELREFVGRAHARWFRQAASGVQGAVSDGSVTG